MDLCAFGVLMAKKYCEKCYSPVEMTDFECPTCSATSFIHTLPSSDTCNCERPLIQGGFGDICDSCSKKIDPSRLHLLVPQPTKTRIKPQAVKTAGEGPMSTSEMINSSNGKGIDDLIRAQNRTTHAVRAFVRFLFIQLTGITFAIFLWNISTAFIDPQKCIEYGTNCAGNTFLQFLAVVVWIASVVWSSQAGWDELAKSNID